MALVFTVTLEYRGATTQTLSLTGAGASGVNLDGEGGYIPRTPELDLSMDTSPDVSGGEISAAAYRNVVETCKVILVGTSTAIQDNLDKMTRWLDGARLYSRGIRGPSFGPLYLNVTLTDGGFVRNFQSEILAGRIELGEDVLDLDYINGMVDASLIWTRRYYWEGDVTTINWTNAWGTNVSPIRIHCEEGVSRSVQARTVSTILGQLPAPLTLTLKNPFSVQTYGQVWATLGATQETPAPYRWLPAFEGEAADNGGTVTANAAATNGNYMLDTWSGTTEAGLISWNLTTLMSQFAPTVLAGQYLKVILKLFTNPGYSDLRMRVALLNQGSVYVIGTGQITTVPSTGLYIDMGVIRIPPNLDDASYTHYPLDLWLNVQRDTAGTHTLAVDALYLAPMFVSRRYVPRVTGITPNSQLIDRGDKAWVQVLGSPAPATGSVENYRLIGPPLVIHPDRQQRLTILYTRDDGSIVTSDYVEMSAVYRPRYISL